MTIDKNIKLLSKIQMDIIEECLQKTESFRELPIITKPQLNYTKTQILKVKAPNIILSETSREKVEQFFKEFEIEKDYPLCRNDDTKGVIDGFLRGIWHHYVVGNLKVGYGLIDKWEDQLEVHSQQILDWLEVRSSEMTLKVLIEPKIYSAHFKTFDKWTFHNPDFLELSLEMMDGWQSNQEGLERVLGTTFFTRIITKENFTEEQIIREGELLSLSLWLALGAVYQIEDLRFELAPWPFAPNDVRYFPYKQSTYWSNTRQSIAVNFWLTTHHTKFNNSWDNLSQVYYDKICNWIDTLRANPKAIYSLLMIHDGFKKVETSISEQDFRKERVAQNGTFQILSGLEGFNSECKPINRKGYPEKNRETFVDCWKAIGESILQNNPSNPVFNRITNLEDALHKIYSLRSDLAHSDPSKLKANLIAISQAYGHALPNDIQAISEVGRILILIVNEFLEYFYENPNDFSKLLNGTKP